MILRSWHGLVPDAHADGFESHMRREVLSDIGSRSGSMGAFLRREPGEGGQHFFLLSYWDGWAAIRAFAGETPHRAVVWPGDAAFGLIGDPVVLHQPCTDVRPWFGEEDRGKLGRTGGSTGVVCLQPAGLSVPDTFSHVVSAAGSRMVFVAGQVAEDERGEVVGPGDMEAQARQVFANIGRALDAAGARPDQVVRLTIFVAGYERAHLDRIEKGRTALFGDHKPSDTLVGVAALTRPEYMLEVDAIAVIDDG
jgi:enamine deaminase RidA (YjgF/YER057c/UK114 family)